MMSIKRYNLAIHASSLGVGVTAAMIEQTLITIGATEARSASTCITTEHLPQSQGSFALRC